MRFAPVGNSSSTYPTVDIRIEGVSRAVANLDTLEYNARRRVVSAAVRAANAVVVRAARVNAPKRSGALSASIRGSLKLDRSTGSLIGTVAFKSTKAQKRKGMDAFYAHMVIGGTKAHQIPTAHAAARMRKEKYGGGADMRYAANRGARARRYAAFEGRVFSRVQHPGIKPNPFMERTAKATFAAAVGAFTAKFAASMDAEVNKLRRGT
jgi:HK97 gp10 family phage protein